MTTGPRQTPPWVQVLWPDPERLGHVRALTTTQQTELSHLSLPSQPHWLKQVHGTSVINLKDWHPDVAADGAWTETPGQVVAVKTADCLPILLACDTSPIVAAIHAGWRGLAAGIIEAGVAALPVGAHTLQAWIGPSISQAAYEVDGRVYRAFADADSALAAYFEVSRPGHWWADLAGMAVYQLHQAGIDRVKPSGLCTASDTDRFYSHRAGVTLAQQSGRMASLIWLE